MLNDEEIELTPEERTMLSGLPREMKPSDLLEERVVRSLRKEGHFGAATTPRRTIGNAWKIAAAIALFAGGVATGGYLMAAKAPASSTAAATPRQNTVVPKDTTTNRTRQLPPATETLVAERELWM